MHATDALNSKFNLKLAYSISLLVTHILLRPHIEFYDRCCLTKTNVFIQSFLDKAIMNNDV